MKFWKTQGGDLEQQSKRPEKSNLYNYYSSKYSSNFEEDDDDTGGLLQKTFGSIKDKITNQANNLTGLTNKMNEVQTAMQSWKQFAIFCGIGVLLILFSFTFLPIVVLVPAKFAALFSLGCLSILVSLAILKGPEKFIKALMQKEKIPYSGSYIFTLVCTLYFSMIHKSYFMVIIFAILQVIAVSFLIASNFPGGTQGMKFVWTKFFGCFSAICGRCFKPKSQSSFLPI